MASGLARDSAAGWFSWGAARDTRQAIGMAVCQYEGTDVTWKLGPQQGSYVLVCFSSSGFCTLPEVPLGTDRLAGRWGAGPHQQRLVQRWAQPQPTAINVSALSPPPSALASSWTD